MREEKNNLVARERVILVIGTFMMICAIFASISKNFTQYDTFTTIFSVVTIVLTICFHFLCYKNIS